MAKHRKTILVILAFVAISAFFHFYFEKEGDGDIFYHLKHAEIYAEKGIFYDQFPWLPYTIIGQNNSDQWYGFHLLLIPFTYFQDPADGSGAGRIFGLKLAGVFITTALLSLFYFALRILKTGKEFFWTLFMLFSAPPVMFHLLLIRPHALSTGLGALLFALLVSGYSNILLFIVSYFLTWFHPNMFWMPILIVGIYFTVEYYYNKQLFWKKFIIICIGVAVGLVVTPNPIGTLSTIIAVVVGEPIAGFRGIELSVGRELLPLNWIELWIFGIFIIAWIVSIFYFRRLTRKVLIEAPKNMQINSAMILSLIFFLMTMFLVKRSMDLWLVFGGLFISLACLEYNKIHPFSRKNIIALNSLFIILIVVSLVFILFIYSAKITLLGWDIKDFKGAGKWLEQNTNEGEILVNLSWDYFQFLFFWNSKNRYTSGTDPMVLYAYDKNLYERLEALKNGDHNDIKIILREFNSKLIFVTQNEAKAYLSLFHNADFERVYRDDHTAIFRLKENK